MRSPLPGSSGLGAAISSVLLVALGARAAWWLLEPLVPTLIVLAVLLGTVRLAAGRRRW